MSAIISVKNLSKSFSYYKKEEGLKHSLKNLFGREKLIKEAVKNISFEIEEGEIVGFLGPNGAGKTTTMKMLSGILHPTSGEATVMGHVPWERKKEMKMRFSIVMGQKQQLWWDLPANESLYLNKHIYEIPDEQYHRILGKLCEMLDVQDLLKVQVRRLSLGERMKMELIAAMIHNPKVIFLDEPTIGLDFISRKTILNFLKQLNEEEKTTIILTSHNMADIEALCDRTIIINNGTTVYEGSLNGVNEMFGERKRIHILCSEEISQSRLEEFGVVRSFDGYEARIEVDKSMVRNCSKALLETFPIVDFNIEDLPLEEGIENIYRGKKVAV